MKHMVIRKTLSIALSCIVLTLFSSGVSSEEDAVSDTLAFYQHKIELFNEKYGTDLALATFSMTESEINDLMIYYSGMTDEEFEEYFYEVVEIAKENQVSECSYKINSCYNESTADCSFPCYWYITGQFTQGGLSYKNVTFTAGKGDVFAFEGV
ncbi:MAG: hypothetical protein K2J73_01275 [Oscillospiraceae bacterium]|nr:hypothetical protein [Oscillospiraceae bacterium]